MIRVALLALLLLLTPTLAHAHDDDWYEYGHVLLHEPVLLESPGEVTISFVVPPGYNVSEPPSFRSCAKWTKRGVHGPWDASPIPTLDRYITVLGSHKSDYRAGVRSFVIGDNHPGRSQWLCLRLPFVQMEEE